MTNSVTPPDSDDYRAAGRAQALAANPDHSAWVAANAGSGKTKVLIDRVARLLLNKAAPASILCVTYTKAAANEMLARLFDRLGAWSIMPDDKLRQKLGELEARPPKDYSTEDISAARSLFARALETPGGLRIETLHAFCSRILRRFPLEAGVAPGFSEIEERDAEVIWRTACRQTLLNTDPAITKALDDISDQKGFGGALGGLDLLRPVAGLAARFAASHGGNLPAMAKDLQDALGAPDQTVPVLLAEGLGPALPTASLRSLLPILEAGKKTDQATAERLRHVLSDATDAARWQTYRAIFATDKAWRARNPYTKDSAKTSPLVADLFQIQDGDGQEFARVRALDDAVRRRAAYERSYALLVAGLPVLGAYAHEKNRRAALDFDDLVDLTRKLLTESAPASWVLYKLDGGLTHVLLDEAQDTSPDQWDIVNALTAEFFAGDGVERAQSPRTQFVVGDEKQSIYSFQGADPQRFLDERRAFHDRTLAAAGEAILPDMAMSFRSSPEVLAFVDKTFEMAALDGPPFTLEPVSAADIARHTARRANQPGRVELWPIDLPDTEDEANPWDVPLDTLPASAPKNRLASTVAGEVRRILDTGEQVWTEAPDRTWHRRPVQAGDLLILVQNRAGGLFDALIDALKSEGLPVAGADRLVLADHIGVQDCLNLLRFALMPSDDLTLAEIMRGPFGRLTRDDEHLFPLAYGRGETSLWVRLSTSTDPRHRRLTVFLKRILECRTLPPFELLSFILETDHGEGLTGWDLVLARLKTPVRDPIRALLSKALAHDARATSSLQTFVAEMETDRSEIKRDLAAAGGEIRVMTVHGAKGLQAPIVILPDTTRPPKDRTGEVFDLNGMPVWSHETATDTPEIAAARAQAKARAQAEHRRLLYVALTRAQDRLILFGHWHGARPKDGDKTPKTGYKADSWYGLCAAAMTALTGVETGLRSFGPPPSEDRTSADDTSPSTLPTPDWLRRPATTPGPKDRFIAPSSLLRDDRLALAPLGPARLKRLKRGRLIHALLQRLPDIPPNARAGAGMTFLNINTDLTDTERVEILDAVLGVLSAPELAHMFDAGGRAEAAIVGTAPELPEGTLINGRVDRLVITERHILIVDYKTDQPPPTRAEDVAETYLAQMGAYSAVLRAAWPGRDVDTALVWTDGPRLMPLPHDLIEKALARSSFAV